MNRAPQAIFIFDLDGTIANLDHRRHLVEGPGKKDWPGFFAACGEDKPVWPVIVTMQVLDRAGYRIEIWSGRKGETRVETETWLKAHHVPYHKLRMRPLNDFTHDDTLKEQWLKALAPEWRTRIVAVYDDRDKVVAMWRRNGLACFQVAEGNF